MDDLLQALVHAGLTEDGARIYSAALALGAASLSAIARAAGIKRPTAYNVVSDVLKAGFISKSPSGKRTLYVAEPPQKILASLRSRELEFENALPAFEVLQSAATTRPRVRFFEGKEGLRSLYREMFTTHHTILGFASIEKIYCLFPPGELAEFAEILRAQGGRIKDLVEDSPEARAYAMASYRKKLGPVKFLPADFSMATDMLIDVAKVAFVSYISIVGVVIEDEAITQTQRQLFEAVWKNI